MQTQWILPCDFASTNLRGFGIFILNEIFKSLLLKAAMDLSKEKCSKKTGPWSPFCLDALAVMSHGIKGNMVTDQARAGPLGMRAVPL